MPTDKKIDTLTHASASRKNIPTAQQQPFVEPEDQAPTEVRYARDTPLEPGTVRERDADLDPQLVWRGKDQQDWSDLVVQAPPIYIQEKIHPKVIIDDLRRRSQAHRAAEADEPDLFGDFGGLPDEEAKVEFYQHDMRWANRMILGDSLQVMASLAEKEGLRGQVQCIYIDPPYGIRFNSNWQVSTRSRDVKDGKADQISREPEQIKAFRDTWKDGIHSYMTYLRDRLTVARDLLSESGSIFVQIGDENIHRVRALMDEVFGECNFVTQISFQKTSSQSSGFISRTNDYIVWFAKNKDFCKFRPLYNQKKPGEEGAAEYKRVETADGGYRPAQKDELSGRKELPDGDRIFATYSLFSSGYSEKAPKEFSWQSEKGPVTVPCPPRYHFKFTEKGLVRIARAGRLLPQSGQRILKRYLFDFPFSSISNVWTDTRGETDMQYVVQTSWKVVQRCLLMTSDPGDLVLDPTCGSGTTAYVAEQWGRRWITIDTSRVSLALTRARLMGGRFPYYYLIDTADGRKKEFEVSGHSDSVGKPQGDIRAGFVYERGAKISLDAISKNTEIDVIWENWQETLNSLRSTLYGALGEDWQEWEIPREADAKWPAAAREAHAKWWDARIARQNEIDASIAQKADQEYLYDKPYEDNSRVRVAGPFTVESLSPHRVICPDEDTLWDEFTASGAMEGESARSKKPQAWTDSPDFDRVILEHLKRSGVHQGDKKDRLTFTAITPWPGEMIAAEGRYMEGDTERRAAIFIGPEFGTVSRPDLVAAAREAGEAGFDLLVACAFNYEALASEMSKLGPVRILRARMNPDLHMSDELANTGSGNLFVVFGEPDVEIETLEDGRLQVKVLGLDIFDPSKGEVRPGGTEDIAAWFIDTDYNEESFFVRHAYFLGANDPYKALKTSLRAEIDEEAWESLNRDVSRPFDRPAHGRIAVKVINHFGDEVMKVFSV